jgi:hypothetical protein
MVYRDTVGICFMRRTKNKKEEAEKVEHEGKQLVVLIAAETTSPAEQERAETQTRPRRGSRE